MLFPVINVTKTGSITNEIFKTPVRNYGIRSRKKSIRQGQTGCAGGCSGKATVPPKGLQLTQTEYPRRQCTVHEKGAEL